MDYVSYDSFGRILFSTAATFDTLTEQSGLVSHRAQIAGPISDL